MQSEAASLSTDEKEGMIELRQELDAMLEWQADDTPEHILNSPLTFVGAAVPPRPGSLKDFLLARRTKAEEEAAATSATDMDMEGVVEGVAEAGTKAEIDESAEARGEVEGMDGGHEDEDSEYPLEDTEAVREAEREVFGEDVNIIGMIRDLTVDDSKKDAEEAEEAGVEMEAPTSPKKSPRKRVETVIKPAGHGRFEVQ
jgi:hypothetical protein